ncbi:hypothetical protein TRSC58_07507 [Trypanosoma rangeli SC58]|uniref:Uncharacterized protein n=1 Tax=Trypanosoma rangeli SC58 TaxID=429131 RepID=A0A061IV53_TRYRA|nr:hypothetical protein TRSC58_07507 [Trypanosoma rangeli SC58]
MVHILLLLLFVLPCIHLLVAWLGLPDVLAAEVTGYHCSFSLSLSLYWLVFFNFFPSLLHVLFFFPFFLILFCSRALSLSLSLHIGGSLLHLRFLSNVVITTAIIISRRGGGRVRFAVRRGIRAEGKGAPSLGEVVLLPGCFLSHPVANVFEVIVCGAKGGVCR